MSGDESGRWTVNSGQRGDVSTAHRPLPPAPPELRVTHEPGGENVPAGFLDGMMIALPPPTVEPMGFFTDSTVCIGCKACEVACKQWNALPSDGMTWSGQSYDNTLHLSATTWRHVSFTEYERPGEGVRWLFNSDVCKHCTAAPCQEACPTGALLYNEFGDVYVQQDVCNGCGYCVVACPFGVLGRSEDDGAAHKAPSATTGRKTASNPPAPRPARPTRSSSGRSPNCASGRSNASLSCTPRGSGTHISTGPTTRASTSG
jgi:Fe-S-cluster-containing dehydrogenase component